MGLTCRKWLGDEFICVCALALIWAPGAHATRVGDMLLENDGAYGYGDIDALGVCSSRLWLRCKACACEQLEKHEYLTLLQFTTACSLVAYNF